MPWTSTVEECLSLFLGVIADDANEAVQSGNRESAVIDGFKISDLLEVSNHHVDVADVVFDVRAKFVISVDCDVRGDEIAVFVDPDVTGNAFIPPFAFFTLFDGDDGPLNHDAHAEVIGIILAQIEEALNGGSTIQEQPLFVGEFVVILHVVEDGFPDDDVRSVDRVGVIEKFDDFGFAERGQIILNFAFHDFISCLVR